MPSLCESSLPYMSLRNPPPLMSQASMLRGGWLRAGLAWLAFNWASPACMHGQPSLTARNPNTGILMYASQYIQDDSGGLTRLGTGVKMFSIFSGPSSRRSPCQQLTPLTSLQLLLLTNIQSIQRVHFSLSMIGCNVCAACLSRVCREYHEWSRKRRSHLGRSCHDCNHLAIAIAFSNLFSFLSLPPSPLFFFLFFFLSCAKSSGCIISHSFLYIFARVHRQLANLKMGSDAISDCNPSHLSLLTQSLWAAYYACVRAWSQKCFQSIDSRQQHVFRPQSKYGSSCLSYIVSTYLFSHQTNHRLPSSDDSLHACSFARCLPYSLTLSVTLIRIRRIRTHGAASVSLYLNCGRHLLGLLWFSSWGPQGLSNTFAGVFARSVWRQRRATDVTGVPVCASTCVFVYLFICLFASVPTVAKNGTQLAHTAEEYHTQLSHQLYLKAHDCSRHAEEREWERCVCL